MIGREVGGVRNLPDSLELVLSGTPAPGGYEALASCFDWNPVGEQAGSVFSK